MREITGHIVRMMVRRFGVERMEVAFRRARQARMVDPPWDERTKARYWKAHDGAVLLAVNHKGK